MANSWGIALLLSADGLILRSSIGFCRTLDITEAQCTGRPLAAFQDRFAVANWETAVANATGDGTCVQDLAIMDKAGRSRLLSLVLSLSGPFRDMPETFFAVAIPRGETCSEVNRIAQSAYTDALTGLFNRRYLEDCFDQFSGPATEAGERFSLFVIDVNDFKSVNDQLGHAAGDAVLREIGSAISRVLPLGSTAVRYGGDEFVAIVPDVPGQDSASLQGEIQSECGRSILIGNATLDMTVSIGKSVFPKHGTTLSELVDTADMRMYQDKRTRRNGGSALPREAARHRNWARYFRTAFSETDLLPHFQPIVDLSNGQTVGAESLCRVSMGQNVILPSEFIPAAEATNAISKVDLAMLTQTARMIAGSRPWFRERLQWSVNMSAQTLGLDNLADRLTAILHRFGLQAEDFCIELTESVELWDQTKALANLGRLRQAGFHLALDDFGTGFSSLSLVKDLPITKIKIDRSFVNGLDKCPRSRAVVQSIAALTQTLGITCVAEGVETRDQVAALRRFGIAQGQGFYWARPGAFQTLSHQESRIA
ncbi:putative bifunctional diguanylate cyclase/phosphodiesterase [Pacificoceanicola onchidii]|uniref:putative bifunctional diguanylate cyclase/phosphodiesterase n=1 Tax=Pacificoceanicola onchidii TaxID=2562685 RepID=UPI001455FCC0|nr:bifunctional diguanylate cyclase/phosphodiesterase [Pacificoceanicola onchidii]